MKYPELVMNAMEVIRSNKAQPPLWLLAGLFRIAQKENFNAAAKFLERLHKMGFIKSNFYEYTIANQTVEHAAHIIGLMRQNLGIVTVTACNKYLSILMRETIHDTEQSEVLFRELKESQQPNEVTYNVMLSMAKTLEVRLSFLSFVVLII